MGREPHFQSPPPRCGSPRILPAVKRHSLDSLVCEEYRVDIASPLSPTKDVSPAETFAYDSVQEDLLSIGMNFANQLSTDIVYCSDQLWSAHDQLVKIIDVNIGRSCVGCAW